MNIEGDSNKNLKNKSQGRILYYEKEQQSIEDLKTIKRCKSVGEKGH